ncbi:FAD/NAD(P)-binding domain-containing protein [Corynespora cassiicola Philippines]|uniref:FAD/NAD(P)-binding domain-containing protein n=1 Tax=Corynespora cassiicola Philippines TaxID=1448308 RepID=A0A2T2NRY4_CORCC|nr:FAD/NAD(P)-binding domain-containing protein [Corynespora cassiicola Philippines]
MTADTLTVDPEIKLKYEEEKQKRIRKDGGQQFIDLINSEQYHHLAEDPWVDHAALNSEEPPIQDGGSYGYLTLGAGYGGLIFAARLIDSGVPAKDIRMVDTAGGFGGTWYWNRYPGLMCDIESYSYMPLLEETGYMPKNRYAYGPELRQYAEKIASHYDLSKNALFRSRIVKQTWDDKAKVWKVHISEYRGPQYGFRDLHGLRVGILGTGATAVQAVPRLAEFAKHLYVFQRTPSSCAERGQRDTDPVEFKKISAEKGWQRKRQENLNSFTRGEPLEENLVRDGWCKLPAFSAVIGSSRKGAIPPQDMQSHLTELEALDLPWAQTLRKRVEEIVEDKEAAENLKFWYPTYCKRPTFHDEYLQSFNKPNVQLVQTAPEGIESATERGVTVNGVEYPVDLMIFSTGYGLAVSKGTGCPADSSDVEVVGRNGLTMPQKWIERGPATLHGVATRDFPNLFFNSSSQSGAACNVSYVLDITATHTAYIIKSARETAGKEQFSVEPTEQAEERWSMETAQLSTWFVAFPTCTPGYYNNYGTIGTKKGPGEIDPKEMIKAARKAPWGLGSQNYASRIEGWRESGKALEDLDILA